MNRFREYFDAVKIPLIVGILLRTVYLIVYWNYRLTSDPRAYFQAGKDLYQGSFEFPNWWPMGTPWFVYLAMKLFDSSEVWTVYVALMLLHVGLIALTGAIAFYLYGRRAAFWAAMFAALYLRIANMVWQPSSHVVEAFALLLGVLLLLPLFKSRFSVKIHMLFLAVSGLAFGFAIITRPSAAVFLVLVPLLILRFVDSIRAQRLLYSIVFLVFAFVVMIPVMAQNIQVGVGPKLSTNNEGNFWLGNNPCTPIFKTWHIASHRKVLRGTPECRTPKSGSEAIERAVSHILHRPDLFLARTFFRTLMFWGVEYDGVYKSFWRRSMPYSVLGGFSTVYIGLWYILFGVFFVALAVGFYGNLPVYWRWLLPLVVFGYQVPYVVAFSAPIYHIPVMFFLFATAGMLIHIATDIHGSIKAALSYVLQNERKQLLLFGSLFLFVQFLSAVIILAYY